MKDLLQQVEELAVVSHVTNLLNEHLSIQDITLAEYLIDLSRSHPTYDEFLTTLNQLKIELPPILSTSIHSFVHTKNTLVKSELAENSFVSSNEQTPTKIIDKRSRWNRSDTETDSSATKYSHSHFELSAHSCQPNAGKRKMDDQWELKQLIASGALPYDALPVKTQSPVRADLNAPAKGSRDQYAENEYMVELNRSEPAFLKDHSKSTFTLSPVRIVRNPQGSLNRAALNGSALLKDSTGKPASKSNDKPIASLADNLLDNSSRNSNGSSGFSNNKANQISKRRDNQIQSRDSVRLPVEDYKDDIVRAVSENPVLIVVGETGSGKTTKIPQYLAMAGYTDGLFNIRYKDCNNGQPRSDFRSTSNSNDSRVETIDKLPKKRNCIACTQPRRVAATSVARRVAQEVGCPLGKQVGYTIRFDDCSSTHTRIKYMTDGMLLRECIADPLLESYSVIILDEAHERTLNTDILFGLLKSTLKQRPDLRLIVTSATLECDKFSIYFDNAPVFRIPGRTFPVEVMFGVEVEQDYLHAAIQTVLQIHTTERAGDILVFLTGQEEIETACAILSRHNRNKSMLILPLYATMPPEQQSLIFEPADDGVRKVVVGTNVAETSITIDGIFYVVDPGFVKQKVYNARLGMDSLLVTPISQSQARQRAGRAGRTGPGKCYRLYTERAFEEEMLPSAIPEIQRTSLTNTLLQLKSMGINDLLQFDFMDRPPLPSMIAALQELYNLGALDNDGLLTSAGRCMSQFPLEPTLAKVVIQSTRENCISPVLTIIAMISTQISPWYRPKGKEEEADRIRARFSHSLGDHLTLLNVYNRWMANGKCQRWASEHFLQARVLRKAEEIRKQLSEIVQRIFLSSTAAQINHDVANTNNADFQSPDSFDYDHVAIRRSITSGCFMHIAHKDTDGTYKTASDRTAVYIHPSSALFGKASGDWVVYNELVCTTREWMRDVTVVDSRWLPELAPGYFTTANSATATNSTGKLRALGGKEDWRLSKRRIVKVSQRF